MVQVLNGVIQPDRGSIVVDGCERVFRSPSDALAVGVAMVFQDIHLGPTLTVAENVMLGREVRSRWGIDWAGTKARAVEQLSELGLGDLDVDTRLSLLSPPTQQLVAIARAMVARPRVLLLDEPTSSLEIADVKRLFGVLRTLRERGVAIVFISHFLEQVCAVSDRVSVLRDGRHVEVCRTQEVDRTTLISLMLGEDVESLRRLGAERRDHQHDAEGPRVLDAVGVGRRGVIESTDVVVHAGEIVGFAGLRGSGRTELAHVLAGVLSADSGVVLMSGSGCSSVGLVVVFVMGWRCRRSCAVMMGSLRACLFGTTCCLRCRRCVGGGSRFLVRKATVWWGTTCHCFGWRVWIRGLVRGCSRVGLSRRSCWRVGWRSIRGC